MQAIKFDKKKFSEPSKYMHHTRSRRHLTAEEKSLVYNWEEFVGQSIKSWNKLCKENEHKKYHFLNDLAIAIPITATKTVANYLPRTSIFITIFEHYSCKDLSAIFEEITGGVIFRDKFGIMQPFNHIVEYLQTSQAIKDHVIHLRRCIDEIVNKIKLINATQQPIPLNTTYAATITAEAQLECLNYMLKACRTKIKILQDINATYTNKIDTMKISHANKSKKLGINPVIHFSKTSRPEYGRCDRKGRVHFVNRERKQRNKDKKL